MSDFTSKHSTDEKPDPVIQEKILSYATKKGLPCAVAFKIANELGIPVSNVGKTADLLDVRLIKCQLGLFGYTPEKKIIKGPDTVDPGIQSAIQNASMDKRLTCENVWNIAASLNVHKMKISSACESMGIKIKKCQLGAF